MAAQIPKQKVSVPSSQSTDLSALFVHYLCEQWPNGLSMVPQMYSVFFFFFFFKDLHVGFICTEVVYGGVLTPGL